MTRRIFRWRIPIDDREHILKNAPLFVGDIHRIEYVRVYGRHAVDLWALVDDDQTDAPQRFRVVGTGHEIRPDEEHIGTTARTEDGLVWHLLRRRN